MDIKHFLLAAVLCGAVWAEEPSISDALDNLPPSLQGKVNETQIESIRNTSAALFKEKCEKNGGPDAFLKTQEVIEKFPTCFLDSIGLKDPTVLMKEIEQAKPNGTVDEVFKKYCAKTPQAMLCVTNVTEAVKPCLSLEEQENLKTVHNITEKLREFICYKDGDRLALFIAEGGPECFQDKQEQIQECVNNTVGSQYSINTQNITANVIPEIKFGEKECKQMSDLEACVVSALEGCNAPTSANIVESLFKFARNNTPCRDLVQAESEAEPRSHIPEDRLQPGSAHGLTLSTSAFIFAVALALY